MTKKKTTSSPVAREEHLNWLVESRCVNQKATLDLRNLLYEYADFIEHSRKLAPITSTLIEVNFSLWRAVFLSELEEGTGSIIRDAKKFIDELIENNTITYTQDKGAKEFTFLYYMENARYRLEELNRDHKNILPDHDYPKLGSMPDKNWWTREQTATVAATANLKRALAEGNSN